jgi:hypothetical protein
VATNAKKTDNHYTQDKVLLRCSHLPEGDIRVLDCFGGKGVIWDKIRKKTEKKISRVAIDIRKDLNTPHLHGDNLKYLLAMDLNKFNAIDLDAYGTPVKQLEILFARNYTGQVYATFIQTMYGGLPTSMLTSIGFTETMVKKSPSLLYKRGWEYFLQWLALQGVTEVHHRSRDRKHYMAFRINGAVES